MEEDFDIESCRVISNNELYSEIQKINTVLVSIEEKINKKIDPLVELLQVIVRKNLMEINENEGKNIVKEKPPFYYVVEDELVIIKGKKTYSNKDKIKENFKDSIWNKEKSAWTFKKFENYEDKLKEVFPDIVKDQ